MWPPGIPRILHTYWHGPLPYLRLLTLLSFRAAHPDIPIALTTSTHVGAPRWTTGEQGVAYTGPDYWPTVPTDVARHVIDVPALLGVPHDLPAVTHADLIRAHVLATVGGVWSDMDVLWLRPLDAYAWEAFDVATVTDNGETGVVLARPGTAYLRNVLALGREHCADGGYQSAGPRAFLAAARGDTAVLALPATLFYPIAWNQTALLTDACVPLPAETLALHWFGGCARIGAFVNAHAEPAALLASTSTLGGVVRAVHTKLTCSGSVAQA